MASSHGAGLNAGADTVGPAHGGYAPLYDEWDAGCASECVRDSFGFLVHTLSLLFVAGALAVFFYETYEKLGLSLLKHRWLNFDRLWAMALILAGFIALLV